MLYVIKSVGIKDKNKPLSLENLIEIIKIGYTEDSSISKRLSNYSTHNKSYEVLFKILKGTQEDEYNLHQFFKEFKYDREWFIVDKDNTIENFFKENKTIEKIRSKIPRTRSKKKGRKFLQEVYKRLRLILPVTSIENFRSQTKIVDDLYKEISDSQIYEIEEFYKWLENKGIKFDKEFIENQLIVPTENQEETIKFFEEYEKLPNLYQKLKYLCEFQFSSELSKQQILDSITEKHFKEYYEVLGPEGCKSLSYGISKINARLNITDTNNIAQLITEINKVFKPGDKYSKKDIKSILSTLYFSIDFKATPKASDLDKYFDLKSIQLKRFHR